MIFHLKMERGMYVVRYYDKILIIFSFFAQYKNELKFQCVNIST